MTASAPFPSLPSEGGRYPRDDIGRHGALRQILPDRGLDAAQRVELPLAPLAAHQVRLDRRPALSREPPVEEELELVGRMACVVRHGPLGLR